MQMVHWISLEVLSVVIKLIVAIKQIILSVVLLCLWNLDQRNAFRRKDPVRRGGGITSMSVCKERLLSRWDHSPHRTRYTTVLKLRVNPSQVYFKATATGELHQVNESPLISVFREAQSRPLEETNWFKSNQQSCVGDWLSEKTSLIAAAKAGLQFQLPVQMSNLNTFVLIDGHHRAALTLLYQPGDLDVRVVIWSAKA